MIQIKITGWTGSRCDGIVLATYGSVIRVAIPGCDDAAEFSCRGGQWFSADGEPVEIAFPAAQRDDQECGSASDNGTARNPESEFLLAPAAAWLN
jgi:hypothetical protein